MVRLQETTGLRITNTVFFILMVLSNYIFEMMPLHGVTIKSVSDAHITLLSLPNFSFLIWGVIYAYLAFFILFQFGIFSTKREANNPDIIHALGLFFVLTCFMNVFWIVAWHYDNLVLSFLLILTFWVTLIIAYGSVFREIKDFKEKVFVQYPLGMYLSWITAATLINAFALLYAYQPDLLGIPEYLWASGGLSIIFGMTMFYIIKHKDYVYGLTSLWVLCGLMYVYFERLFTDDSGMYIFLLLVSVSAVILFTILIAAWLQHNKSQFPQSSRNRDFYQ